MPSVNPRVFLDFAIDNVPAGRAIVELFADRVPKTCENFRALATGEKGVSPHSNVPLYYKNSPIHRSIKDFMIQGGDFTQRNGKGGESIYGAPFADEDLSTPLNAQGLLCMANKGPNTNGSQWFITLKPCPHLNGKHVVFGRVIRGFDEIILKIADVPTGEQDRPSVPVIISNCGELELRRPPPKPASTDRSESDPESEPKKKRSKRRSSSNSRSRRTKRSKHNKIEEKPRTPEVDESRNETEEEYDARLEREEKERIEAARRRELERVRERLAAQKAASETSEGGVRYKGRGRMKFIDPESRSHRHHDD